MNSPLLPLHEQVGFDYIAAVRHLLVKMTYEDVAFALGYESVGGVSALLKGRTPSHVKGEALWALYCDTFGCKPPLLKIASTIVEPSV